MIKLNFLGIFIYRTQLNLLKLSFNRFSFWKTTSRHINNFQEEQTPTRSVVLKHDVEGLEMSIVRGCFRPTATSPIFLPCCRDAENLTSLHCQIQPLLKPERLPEISETLHQHAPDLKLPVKAPSKIPIKTLSNAVHGSMSRVPTSSQ